MYTQLWTLFRLIKSILSFSAAPPAATNVIRQDAKALPTLDDRKKSNCDDNKPFASKSDNAIDKEPIININTLNPCMNKLVLEYFLEKKIFIYNLRWTIKARVSNKGQIRNYSNARGSGKFFNCDLVDQSGEIRATAFNAECDKYHSLLEVGEVNYSLVK